MKKGKSKFIFVVTNTMSMVELGTVISPVKVKKCGTGEYPVLSMTMHDGLVFQSDKFKKEIASKDRSEYKVVFKNQLVIGFPIDEAVLAAQRITDAGIVSPAYGIWDIDQNKIIPEFLEYALRCNRAISYYKAKLRGSTARRRSLPTPTLLAFEIPLPPLDKQRKILDIVNKSYRIIEFRKQQLTALDTLVKARFVEMFGEQASNKWNISLYGKEFFITSGGTPATSEIEYWDKGTISWIGSNMCQNKPIFENDGKFITQKGLDNSSAKVFKTGTVLVALVGATIGKTALLKFDTATNQNVAAIDVNGNENFCSEYVFYHLQTLYYKFQKIGNGKFKMANQGFIKELPIFCPPITLQTQFASFVTQVDKSKVAVQKALDEAQTLFDSLMQEYFG